MFVHYSVVDLCDINHPNCKGKNHQVELTNQTTTKGWFLHLEWQAIIFKITQYMYNSDCNLHMTQLGLGIHSNTPQVIFSILVNGMIYYVQMHFFFFFLIPAFQQTLRSDFTLNLFVLGRYIITLLLPFPEYNYFP